MSLPVAITIALWPVIVVNLVVMGLNASGRAPWLAWPMSGFLAALLCFDLGLFGLVLSILLTVG